MKIKIISLAILAVVIVFGAGYYFYTKNLDVVNAPKQPATSASKFEDKKITDNTKPFVIDITYPYLEGLNDFNSKVKNEIDQRIADFKKYSLENDEAVKKIDPESYNKYPREYNLTINYIKGQLDENVASALLTVYSFTGGAHGSGTFVPFNYSVKDKKHLKLADLFLGQADYLQKVSSYCEKDLTQQIEKRMEEYSSNIDTDWIKRGTTPTEENYSNFLIENNDIIVYFQEYQVAAYAFGSFEVKVPKQI